jgi:hypothetical protein
MKVKATHNHSCQDNTHNCNWFLQDENEILLPAGITSEYVYFINSGTVNIMDRTA